MAGNGINEVYGQKNLTSNEIGSSALIEEEDDLPEYDWEDHWADQLKAHLINNLLHKFQTAVNQVDYCGQDEVVAAAAGSVSRNYVQGRTDGSLRSLAKYFVLEMTNTVLMVRQGLTTTQALQCLLMTDMDLARACSVSITPHPHPLL